MSRRCGWVLLAASVPLLASCGPVPQSADQFREMIRVHHRGRVETWQVDDPPRQVLERLDRAYAYCVDREERHCSQGCSVELHHHELLPSSGGKTTIAVQVEYGGRQPRGAPPGGLYEMVIDVEAKGRRTEVTWYGGNHDMFAPYVDATKRWSEALEHPVRCPGD